PGLGRPVELRLGERRLVDEHIGAVCSYPELGTWAGVAGDGQLAPRTRSAHHLLGGHSGHGLASLQAAEIRAGTYAERRRGLRIKLPRPLVLEQDVSEGRRAVVHRHRRQVVSVPAQYLPRLQL